MDVTRAHPMRRLQLYAAAPLNATESTLNSHNARHARAVSLWPRALSRRSLGDIELDPETGLVLHLEDGARGLGEARIDRLAGNPLVVSADHAAASVLLEVVKNGREGHGAPADVLGVLLVGRDEGREIGVLH